MDRAHASDHPSWAVLMREAERHFGVRALRPGQRELIDAVFAGRDAIGVLPTGAGKSLCFQLPALFLPHATVVVSPLLALMQDQKEKLEDANIPTTKLDSTLTASEEREAEEEIAEGAREIVYVTPERLERPDVLDLFREQRVSLLVVDEAHCISQWGHDFRPAYLALRDARAELRRPPVLALTATATDEVLADVARQLALRDPLVVRGGVERPNLFFEVHRTVNEDKKREHLRALLAEEEGAGIVYVATVKEAEALTNALAAQGASVAHYHGRMKAPEREEAQARFMNGEVQVLVATKAFGMGIDKHDIRFVVHWDFPDSVESYYQEAGRAGRDGRPARAILFYRLEDRRIQSYFLGGKYPRRDELLRVYEALRALAKKGEQPAAARLAEMAGAGERRTKVVVATLEAAGVVARRRGALALVRTFPDAGALERYLHAYASRAASDRERLATMMRYGETTQCRVQFLRRYFGEPEGERCGHCDNCRDRPDLALRRAA